MPSKIPRLRRGENQGDIFATQTETLALIGETCTDHQAEAEQKQKEERETADAKRAQERQQILLFPAD